MALRIPESLALDLKLESGSLAEISVVDGKIVISPSSRDYSIRELALIGGCYT